MLTTRAASRSRRSPSTNPDALVAAARRPLEGFQPYQARAPDLRRRDRRPERAEADPRDHRKLYAASSRRRDALRGQPADRHAGRRGAALDSKFTVDDNALFRIPTSPRCATRGLPPEERAAREKGVTYVKLDGEVGILGNGAGLSMSTLDVIALAAAGPRTSATSAAAATRRAWSTRSR
jgi:succinyl-CoA synthetase beta subunit